MILKIHWPYKIRNDTVYERAGEIEWSKKIEERRMKWLGHMLRLPENTPANLALKESLRPVKRPRGRQKDTWNTIINRQLKEIGLSLGDPRIEEIAQDRKQWRFLTNGGGAVPTNGGNALQKKKKKLYANHHGLYKVSVILSWKRYLCYNLENS